MSLVLQCNFFSERTKEITCYSFKCYSFKMKEGFTQCKSRRASARDQGIEGLIPEGAIRGMIPKKKGRREGSYIGPILLGSPLETTEVLIQCHIYTHIVTIYQCIQLFIVLIIILPEMPDLICLQFSSPVRSPILILSMTYANDLSITHLFMSHIYCPNLLLGNCDEVF